MGSPSVHAAESLDDAMKMFDSHVPLTFREKKLILESLYDLGFRDGARQGRQAGVEAARTDLKAKARELGCSEKMVSDLLPLEEAEAVTVHQDPTVKIRRHLEDKQRAIAQVARARNGK